MLHVQSSVKQKHKVTKFEVMMTTRTYKCKFLIPFIQFSGVHGRLVLGYSLRDNRKIITSRQIFISK